MSLDGPDRVLSRAEEIVREQQALQTERDEQLRARSREADALRRAAEELEKAAQVATETATGAAEREPDVMVEVLRLATEAVERGAAYGDPAVHHERTATLWRAYLQARWATDVEVFTAEDVCWLNVLQKISRSMGPKTTIDNYVDVAGYAANAARCRRAAEETP